MKTMNIFLTICTALLLVACSKREDSKNHATFTLKTGVSIVKKGECRQSEVSHDLKINKVADGEYRLSFNAPMSCGAKIGDSYLTIPKGGRATFVVQSVDGDSCECSQHLVVNLTKRLEPGSTLYVYSGEVLGHLQVP